MDMHEHKHDDRHGHGHDRRTDLFIDNDPYDWDKPTINGAQLRRLGSVPDDVQIFWKVPGRPDVEVKKDTVIDLRKQPGPDHFSTQSVGSQAG
jgi:hypothetical protein